MISYSNDGAWGRAVHFAADAKFTCQNYSHQDENKDKCVILAQVIVGNPFVMPLKSNEES